MVAALPRSQLLCLMAIALGVPLSAIGALYPENTWLQVGPVAAMLPFASWALSRWPLSNSSVVCATCFLLMHLLAARWSYSYVPYRQWIGPFLGQSAAPGRNMFDRAVHFTFGATMTAPAAELFRRRLQVRPLAALLLCFLALQAISALYEIFEWLLAVLLSPASAEAYNGQQGDAFDSQKDMLMALIGNATVIAGMIIVKVGEPAK